MKTKGQTKTKKNMDRRSESGSEKERGEIQKSKVNNGHNKNTTYRENLKKKPVATIMKRLKTWLGSVSQMNGKILSRKLYEIRSWKWKGRRKLR